MIDPAAATLFVAVASAEHGTYTHKLRALEVLFDYPGSTPRCRTQNELDDYGPRP